MSLPLELFERFEGGLVWGERDCVQFAAAARATPVEHGFRYSSKAEADALIARAGSLKALVSSILGPGIRPEKAESVEDGDTVLTYIPGQGEALGAVSGGVFFILQDSGFVPLRLTKAAWIWPCRSR